MARLPTLVWLALRELWISFRLIPLVGLPILAGSLFFIFPPEATEFGPVAGAGHLLAIGLLLALALLGSLAAATFAGERRRGTISWLVVRAVPRSAVLIAWFGAFAIPLVAGICIGAAASWLAALERVPTPPDATPFTAAVGGMIGIGMLVLAAGLALGSLLPPRAAFAASLGISAVALGLTLLGPSPGVLPPLQPLVILADLERGSTPVADAVRSAGLSLVAAAALLVLAAAVTERRDL